MPLNLNPLAETYQQTANANMGAAVGSASVGLGFAQQGVGAAQNALNGLNLNVLPALQSGAGNLRALATQTNQFADQAAQSAAGMGQDIGAVRGQAAAVNAQGQALLPYAQTIRGMADTLWNQGLNLAGQGGSIMALDETAPGLAGEITRWVQSIDPDKYVSMAAADVLSSGDNAAGQMLRAGTRSGLDASSSAMQAQRQKLYQSLAATLAGAKTRARQQGLAERGQALQAALGNAQNLLKQGMDAQGAGLSGQQAAAGVEANAGQLMGQAGQIYGTAGQLGASQANAYTNAGQLKKAAGDLEGQAASLMATWGNLSLNGAKALVDAYGTAANASNAVAAMQAKAAQYYAEVAEGYGAAGSFGGGGGGGGGGGYSIRVTSSGDDSWKTISGNNRFAPGRDRNQSGSSKGR